MIQSHAGKVHAHIPVRNPLDVAKSWASRGKKGQADKALLLAYQMMFAHIAAHGDCCTFYRMEDLPRLKGTDEHKGVPYNRSKVQHYQDLVRTHVIAPHMDFFLQFYDEESLNAP